MIEGVEASERCGIPPATGGYTVLYARWEDGGWPIRVYECASGVRTYGLVEPEGGEVVEWHASTRSLLTRLTGVDRHWGHERYFREGRWGSEGLEGEEITVLDLFSGRRPGEEEISVGGCSASLGVSGSEEITTDKRRGRPFGLAALDLDRRHGEVRKLLFAGFGGLIYRARWDEEEVVQEVFKGLLSRNQPGMKSAWDPEISSFGHYIHMVCRSVVFNFHRKQERVQRIQVGARESVDGKLTSVDVASSRRLTDTGALWQNPAPDPSDQLDAPPIARLTRWVLRQIPDPIEAMLAVDMIPHLAQDRGQREIARAVGLTRLEYKNLLDLVREVADEWSAAGCP